jgi:hypothetical protein
VETIVIRKLLREPLVHFLLLGAIVFAIFHFTADRSDVQEGKIVVTSGKIEQLATGFSRTWHRPPTRQELDGLTDDYIREEVLYRQALAMGLDKDDTIVRRRMRQKLEFLTEEASAAALPTDQDLQSWLDQHPDKFRIEPAAAFSQIYFNPGRHGKPALPAASQALAQLGRAGGHSASAELGDATMLPREMALTGIDEVGRVFGNDFAGQVAQLQPGFWTGPLQSSYGWHLVRVSERTEGRSRPLSEVREAVRREWQAARSKEVVDSTYAKLRGKYTVVVEGPEVRAGAGLSSGGVANAAERP